MTALNESVAGASGATGGVAGASGATGGVTVAEVPVGSVTDLTPGEGRTYVVDGRQIAVFLLADGTVRAMDAVCPHRAGPLADGQIDGAVVTCPLHQYAFRFDTGACTSETVAPVRVYPAQVCGGTVTVQIRSAS